jgi:hypothetical protein
MVIASGSRMRAPLRLALPFVFLLACWNYRAQLDRADTHYHSGDYSAAITNLDDLSPSLDSLDVTERCRHAWLRGMSAQRLGQRADARHWLARARELLERGATLPEDMRNQLQRTLLEVDWVVQPTESTAGQTARPAVASGTEPQDSRDTATTNIRN